MSDVGEKKEWADTYGYDIIICLNLPKLVIGVKIRRAGK
jgi:hypothetical protein